MNAAGIQAKVNQGYAIAARKTGYPFTQYRPSDPLNPLAEPMRVLPATFSINDKFSKSPGFKDPSWRCFVDGAKTQAGDYLVEVSPTQTGQDPRIFYVLSQQPLLPISAVMCHQVLTVHRQPVRSTAGRASGYGGDVQSLETVILSGWPCSMTQGTKGEKPDSGIPSETRLPWYSCLLPKTPGVMIATGDIGIDGNAIRYSISSVELTDLGWRLTLETDTV